MGWNATRKAPWNSRTVNFGAVVGAGVSVRVNGPVRAFVNSMYAFGLTSLIESEDSQLRAITFEAGLSFALK